MKEILLKDLQCPYCTTPFTNEGDTISNSWTSIKCQCSEFPIINGILVLKKLERKSNNNILKSINSSNKIRAVWYALSDEPKKIRLLLIGFFLYSKIFGHAPLSLITKTIHFFDPKKQQWMQYIQNTKNRDITRIAIFLVTHRLLHPRERILDIGCGPALMLSMIVGKVPDQSKSYGIDTSFFTLFIGSLAFKSRSIQLICVDAENGLPFKKNSISTVLECDSFPWIIDKMSHVQELYRILASKSRAYIINIHALEQHAHIKSYHISTQALSRICKKFFSLFLFDHTRPVFGSIKTSSCTGGYSCILQKK